MMFKILDKLCVEKNVPVSRPVISSSTAFWMWDIPALYVAQPASHGQPAAVRLADKWENTGQKLGEKKQLNNNGADWVNRSEVPQLLSLTKIAVRRLGQTDG